MELLEDSARQEVRMRGFDGGLPGMQLFSDGGFVRSVGGRTGKGGFLSIRPTLPRSGLRSPLQKRLLASGIPGAPFTSKNRSFTREFVLSFRLFFGEFVLLGGAGKGSRPGVSDGEREEGKGIFCWGAGTTVQSGGGGRPGQLPLLPRFHHLPYTSIPHGFSPCYAL